LSVTVQLVEVNVRGRVADKRTVAGIAAGLVAAALLAAFPAAGGSSAPAPPSLVFVLAGQSNMLGRGFPLASGDPSSPNLLVYRPESPGGWKVAADPLGDPNDGDDGIGPGMSFGLAVAAAGTQTVGLIQCATGGSSISDWGFGKKLYRDCVAQLRAAHATPAGLLFLQGESEARGQGAAKKWEKRFLKLVPHFEKDFGPAVLLGQIGTITDARYPYQATVRAGQADAAVTLGIPLIVTSDLPMVGVHYTVPSYKEIGLRYAAAWLGT
jgi:Carbohydrate esterase, sialic acid-specific acetylesterase